MAFPADLVAVLNADMDKYFVFQWNGQEEQPKLEIE